MNDTSPEIEKLMFEKIKALTPEERVVRMCHLIESGRELIKANLKAQNPNSSEEELCELFAERVLGEELAEKFIAHLKNKKIYNDFVYFTNFSKS